LFSTSDLLRPATDSAQNGQPARPAPRGLSLLEALSAHRPDMSPLSVVHAYWIAAGAAADYSIEQKHHMVLESFALGALSDDQQRQQVESALAASQARRQQAWAALDARSLELAAYDLRPRTGSLPLPQDVPHVRVYHTRFEDIYRGRPAPQPIALLNQLLPDHFQSVQLRTDAVLAADRALESALDATSAGESGQSVDTATLLRLLEQQRLRQREFTQAVVDYNRSIATYALGVAPPGLGAGRVTAMLIRDAKGSSVLPTGWHAAAESPQTVQTPLTSPTDAGSVEPANFLDTQQPTPAQPPMNPAQRVAPPITPQRAPDQPTRRASSANQSQPSRSQPHHLELDPARPDRTPARETPGTPPNQPTLADPLPADRDGVIHNEAIKDPLTDEQAIDAHAAPLRPSSPSTDVALFAALVDMPPQQQAAHLTQALHGQNETSSDDEGITLDDLLETVPGNRRPVIAAFWSAREHQANELTLKQALQQCEVLKYQMLEKESLEPADASRAPGELVQLDALTSRLEADLAANQLNLRQRRWELMTLTGRPLNTPWLMPLGVPCAGSYPPATTMSPTPTQITPVTAQPTTPDSAPALNMRQQQVIAQAAALVVADQLRARTQQLYITNETTLQQALAALDAQQQASAAFLESLTLYNVAIADEVLSKSPPGTPGRQLAAALQPGGENAP
jgi:hypothetical protein